MADDIKHIFGLFIPEYWNSIVILVPVPDYQKSMKIEEVIEISFKYNLLNLSYTESFFKWEIGM